MNNAHISIDTFDQHKHSVNEITELLHDSYSIHLQNNLHFWATTQTNETTYKRLTSGISYVAILNNKIIGTITYYSNCPSNNCDYYQQKSVGRFGQFAVDRSYQKKGIGNLLIKKVIEIAKTEGKCILALDTSELALELIKYYERKGFNKVGKMQWNDVNYTSIILSKNIE